MSRLTLIVVLLGAIGCADKIHHDNPDAATPGDGNTGDAPAQTGKVRTTRGGDATYTTVVDSTSATDWAHADFETGGEVASTAPWDLRFQRFHISTNGGVSGTGGVQVAAVTGTAFAAVTAAPATGFITDTADGNGDGLPDYAFDQGDSWYSYDDASHLLTPRPIVWVLKTAGGSTLKLEIVKYYDDAGTSGWFTVHWAAL
jgi:hypothetical protein